MFLSRFKEYYLSRTRIKFYGNFDERSVNLLSSWIKQAVLFFFIFFFVFFPYVKETCCTAIRSREIHREEMEKKGRRFPWQFRSFRLMPYMCVWNVKHDIYIHKIRGSSILRVSTSESNLVVIQKCVTWE